ncbi:uncharacterized protein CMU_011050 [Cryptosporidium muris RN66]|uniref:Dynactin subunit 5 n=1 Tax=Cryptosporidium muris (strain RN66) TaxID=441375 RepID=B6AIW6_CRYMR|nr:uncharacterized protein CMU_011050 [Cryptosporidium muris RN66]EEA08157.1 hypothetical protein, conserved [Cryptosporidium muris RN66]|eukprot:XP_002142506.1 hypothetical protein [Cryptosporidium muris RN66]
MKRFPIKRNRKEYIQTASGNIVCRKTILCGSQNIHLLGTCIIDQGVILRGDLAVIRIGQYVILEPNCIIRPSFKRFKEKYGSIPISIGDCVHIGENSIVMATSIGSNILIGDNCIIGHASIIKDNCIILPNTVISPDTVIPPFTEWSGNPGIRLPESTSIKLQQDTIDYYTNYQLISLNSQNSIKSESGSISRTNTSVISRLQTGIEQNNSTEISQPELNTGT